MCKYPCMPFEGRKKDNSTETFCPYNEAGKTPPGTSKFVAAEGARAQITVEELPKDLKGSWVVRWVMRVAPCSHTNQAALWGSVSPSSLRNTATCA